MTRIKFGSLRVKISLNLNIIYYVRNTGNYDCFKLWEYSLRLLEVGRRIIMLGLFQIKEQLIRPGYIEKLLNYYCCK